LATLQVTSLAAAISNTLRETRLAWSRPGFLWDAMEPNNEKSRDETLAAYERGVMILLFILAVALLALAVWLAAYLFSV
jgi:hypothetical protein